jgi:DNA-binding CsgD family transcriptional regulator
MVVAGRSDVSEVAASIASGVRAERLVGRREERIRLRDAVAGSGAGAIALCGEPGIGKTRLLAELVAFAEEAGQLTLSGRAAQFERDAPFAVFIDALDGHLAAQNPRTFERVGARHLVELGRIFPALGLFAKGDAGAGQSERYRAHYAVAELLKRLAAARPLLLALDDLHWADEASLELLAHLLRRPPGGVRLLAIAYRPGEAPARLAASVDGAVREDRIDRIELGPLNEEDAQALLCDDGDSEWIAWLCHECGGNPFYLEQLRRWVAGNPVRRNGAQPAGSDHGVPEAVAAALACEVAGLSSSARRLIEGASVAGDPFALELATHVAELPEAHGRDALDELLTRGLAHPTGVPRQFRFRHPIVHRTVYAGTRPGWRIGAHARARDLLERHGASPTQLAHHVEQAATPGDESAIAVLESAGHAATDLAPGPAADWFGAALRLLPARDPSRRLELLVPMATALAASGRMEESRAALLEAIEAMPPGAEENRVRLISFLAAIDHLLGHHDEPRALLSSALEGLSDPRSRAAVALQIELGIDALYMTEYQAAQVWAERALASARLAEAPVQQAMAAATAAMAYVATGAIPEALRHREAATTRFDGFQDNDLAEPPGLAFWVGYGNFFLERYADAARVFHRGVALERAARMGQFLVQLQIGEAWSLYYVGRLSQAKALAAEAVEAARLAPNPQALSWALFVYCWIVTGMGDLDSGLRAGEESVAIAAELDESVLSAAAHAHFAAICAEAGHHERCAEEMRLAGAPDFPVFYADRKPHWWEVLARIALSDGREDEAEQWIERGERFVDGLDLPVATGVIRRARARLLFARDEPEPAAELALRAAELQRVGGAPIEAARSAIVAGRALAAGDRAECAVEQLERAWAELNACGAARYRDEAARELRRLGRSVPRVAPRSAARQGVEALSGREREIAGLAAEAKTNREIAAILYISEKTVEKHLSRACAKLGISGRAAIGAKLAMADSEAAHRRRGGRP